LDIEFFFKIKEQEQIMKSIFDQLVGFEGPGTREIFLRNVLGIDYEMLEKMILDNDRGAEFAQEIAEYLRKVSDLIFLRLEAKTIQEAIVAHNQETARQEWEKLNSIEPQAGEGEGKDPVMLIISINYRLKRAGIKLEDLGIEPGQFLEVCQRFKLDKLAIELGMIADDR
jgi:hypothetical protein